MSDPSKPTYAELMKIGEFAAFAGCNLRTLRYYEERGLLQPRLRSEGGFRYYRPSDANRVNLIQSLQQLGLQLDEIGALLEPPNLPAAGEGRRQAWTSRIRDALKGHGELIQRRITTLNEQQTNIEHALTKLESCRSCEHSPEVSNNFCEPCQQTGDDLPPYLSALF